MTGLRQRITSDGGDGPRAALVERIRSELLHEYAEALRHAGFWRRLWLRIVIRIEIAVRLHEHLPLGVHGRTGR